jgi:hypothetical protein
VGVAGWLVSRFVSADPARALTDGRHLRPPRHPARALLMVAASGSCPKRVPIGL